MEPSPLNSPDDNEADRRLADWLRRASPELPDHGFSARVLAALPPPRPAPTMAPITLLTAAIGALAGLAIALFQGGSWSALLAGIRFFGDTLLGLVAAVSDPFMGLALAAAAASILATIRLAQRETRLN